MSLSDPLGNMLAAIKNGQMAKKQTILVPASKAKANVLEVLKREGYINDYRAEKNEKGHNNLVIDLRYYQGSGVIGNIKRVSKPGRRVYTPIGDLKRVSNGLGISVLSTSRGVLSDYEAITQNVGGEVICEISVK